MLSVFDGTKRANNIISRGYMTPQSCPIIATKTTRLLEMHADV